LTSLTHLTLAEARDKLRSREISSREITSAHLGAIEQARGLNAYVVTTIDKALQMAEASDARLGAGEGGPLEGLPIGIKDLYATEGIHTQACSHILDGFRPPYESTVTSNLWRDGAVMLGKLNMDEFAMGSSNETSWYGPVASPWLPPNWSRQKARAALANGKRGLLTPGGSSGGSAAAVAARLCLAATASDTGGSIRQPAAFTGVVGIKPTYGRCSRWGMVAFASSLDQAGPLARTVRDAAIMLRSMAGPDRKDSTCSLPSRTTKTLSVARSRG
jgi:aspartyl-tRNA(Asn)/glutamyl-tRNA(Gln) amidotransferase subunit A